MVPTVRKKVRLKMLLFFKNIVKNDTSHIYILLQ